MVPPNAQVLTKARLNIKCWFFKMYHVYSEDVHKNTHNGSIMISLWGISVQLTFNITHQQRTILLINKLTKTALKPLSFCRRLAVILRSCCSRSAVVLRAICGLAAMEMRLTFIEPQRFELAEITIVSIAEVIADFQALASCILQTAKSETGKLSEYGRNCTISLYYLLYNPIRTSGRKTKEIRIIFEEAMTTSRSQVFFFHVTSARVLWVMHRPVEGNGF